MERAPRAARGPFCAPPPDGGDLYSSCSRALILAPAWAIFGVLGA
jgi:hypothetical protein